MNVKKNDKLPEMGAFLLPCVIPCDMLWRYRAEAHSPLLKMFKTLAIVAALTLGAGSAMAAEVGIRHSAGSSYRSITNGTSVYNFDGRSVTNTRTTSSAVTERGALGGEAGFCPPGQSECGGPSAENPALFDGASTGGGFGSARTTSNTRTNTTDVLNFSGRDTNRFAGGDSSVFSETSIFAQ